MYYIDGSAFNSAIDCVSVGMHVAIDTRCSVLVIICMHANVHARGSAADNGKNHMLMNYSFFACIHCVRAARYVSLLTPRTLAVRWSIIKIR